VLAEWFWTNCFQKASKIKNFIKNGCCGVLVLIFLKWPNLLGGNNVVYD